MTKHQSSPHATLETLLLNSRRCGARSSLGRGQKLQSECHMILQAHFAVVDRIRGMGMTHAKAPEACRRGGFWR